MRLSRTLLFPLALALALSACGDSEPMSSSEGDRADEGFDIIDINLGESLTGLSVERLQVDVNTASKAQINRSTAVFRLLLPAGQSASIVMRAEDPGLDSYLLVKDLRTGETVTKGDDQEFIGSAGELDAVVSLRAEEEKEYLIVATGGANMQTSGRFTIDSIAHSDPGVDLSATGPALRVLTSRLRDREPTLVDWLDLGAVEESEVGTLAPIQGGLTGIPLQQRAQFNGFIGTLNDERLQLFDEMISRSGSEGATRDSVGRAVASIYRTTRQLP